MSYTKQEMPDFLLPESQHAEELSITGKWVPLKKGGLFRKSADSEAMSKEWEDIHAEAKLHPGILSTEVNDAIGEEAVLVHHTFRNEEDLVDYFSGTASMLQEALSKVAKPDSHLVRGTTMSKSIEEGISSKGVRADFGEYLYGYVNREFTPIDPSSVIEVTAKWTCKQNSTSNLEELKYWWQRVGTDAHEIEPGLIRFEVYQVKGEDALIIHETFANSDVLKFHLSKGTAEKYKKDIDKIAVPENYFFRGPVAWSIRMYSKFMKLPATYTRRKLKHLAEQGSRSDSLG